MPIAYIAGTSRAAMAPEELGACPLPRGGLAACCGTPRAPTHVYRELEPRQGEGFPIRTTRGY